MPHCRLFLTLVCVLLKTLFFFKFENEIRQKFGAFEKIKGTDCQQRPLLATGRELQYPDALLPRGSGLL